MLRFGAVSTKDAVCKAVAFDFEEVANDDVRFDFVWDIVVVVFGLGWFVFGC